MHALTLSLLSLPLLAAAAPTTQPALEARDDISGGDGTTCSTGTGPSPNNNRDFFDEMKNFLSSMPASFNAPQKHAWSHYGNKGNLLRGTTTFTITRSGWWEDPKSCVNILGPTIDSALDKGATGGSWTATDGGTSCSISYVIGMDNRRENVCSSW